jgi:hypothetical protein
MNLINRIVITLLLLALFAGAIAVIVLTWAMPDDSISGLRDAVDWLEDNNEDLQKALLTMIAALVALVCFTALVLEFVPSSGGAVKVTDVQTGQAVLTTAAIAQRIQEDVRAVPNVSDVRAVVKTKRKGVDVMLDLHVDPHANLAVVTNDAIEATRRVLNDKVHVALAEPPRVRLHYKELRLQRQQPSRPETPAPVAPPDEAAAEGESAAAPPAPAAVGAASEPDGNASDGTARPEGA